jgi:hypothetical protein
MTDPTPATTPAAAPATELLSAARAALAAASLAQQPQQRYVDAHIAALRAAAAVLATRTRPVRATTGPRSAWALLGRVAPELGEWAAFFAAGTSRRQAAELGALRGAGQVVTTREADDLLRDAQTFLALVETTLGRHHQASLPLTAAASSSSSSSSSLRTVG